MAESIPIVVAIPANEFEGWRDSLAWHFQSFADRSGGGNTVESIIKSILDRETQCWAVMDGAEIKACALTHIANDAGKTCVVLACAGKDFKEWFELLVKTLYSWSKEIGSNKFQVQARPGWEKYLKHLGMKKTHIVMELD